MLKILKNITRRLSVRKHQGPLDSREDSEYRHVFEIAAELKINGSKPVSVHVINGRILVEGAEQIIKNPETR